MSVIPIFISPSSQPLNSCKYGDNEEAHMRTIAIELDNLFKKDNRFISVVCSKVSGTDSQKLETICKTSDTWIDSINNRMTPLHLSLHSNAGGGKGHECYYFSSNTMGKRLSELICDEMNKISPWKTRACEPHDGFYEIHVPKYTSILFECAFHDDIEQANWIHNNNNILNIAKVIYRAVLRLFDFKEITPIIPVTVIDNVDRVWKQDLVKKCIDNGLLEDVSWIENYNKDIPIYAVCKMFSKMLDKLATIEKNTSNVNNQEILNQISLIVLKSLKDIESNYEIVDIKGIVRKKE